MEATTCPTNSPNNPSVGTVIAETDINKLETSTCDPAPVIEEKCLVNDVEISVNDTDTPVLKPDVPSVSSKEAETIDGIEKTDIGVNNETETSKEYSGAEQQPQQFRYSWNILPKLLCSAVEDYIPNETNENFTKGCQWSPDGTCLLVPAEDFRIRVYDLPKEMYNNKIPPELPLDNLKPALSVREGGLVYDSCWYPLMNSWDPATCCFLSTSRESPLHLWDAFTGELRATYRPYNQVDEVEAAISLQFVDGGQEIWCGFKGALRSFDTNRPGRQKETISLKKDFPNVRGLVSCIRENPIMPGLIAFGTYSKSIGLYKDGPLCSFQTDSGVTQIEFSPCGTKLYTAVRRSNEFLCWDLRNPGVLLYSMKNRRANTNQRIMFAVSNDGTQIVSGGTDGFVSVWQEPGTLKEDGEEEELSPLSRIQLSKDCINGVSIHRCLPILATSSGQRHCDDELGDRDNGVRLWLFQAEQ